MVITGVGGQVVRTDQNALLSRRNRAEDGQSCSMWHFPRPRSPTQAAEKTRNDDRAAQRPNFSQVNPGDVEWVDRLSTRNDRLLRPKARYTGKEALVTRRTYVLAERSPSPITHATYAK